MAEIDLWADDPIVETIQSDSVSKINEVVEIDIFADETSVANAISPEVVSELPEVLESAPDFKGKDYFVSLKENELSVWSYAPIKSSDFHNIMGLKEDVIDGFHKYSARAWPQNAFVLSHFLKGEKIMSTREEIAAIKEIANAVPLPKAYLTEDGKHVHIDSPNLKVYRDMFQAVNAYPTKEGHRIDITRVLDLEAISETTETKLPRIVFAKEVLDLNREPIVGFDGTLDSLKLIPIASLNVVSANGQSWKALKNSSKTLEEKMESFGLKSLHDLLFWLPRRYIDKSKPQEIRDLIEGESATIVGKIKSASDMPNLMGVAFQIETDAGEQIRTSFFRQNWLKAKFRIGQEVLITGKFGWWQRKPQLNGSSIELSEEAAILPIVPVYRQSESRGITTHFIMAANRELLSRLGSIQLPVYFRQAGRMDYCEALTELHFPTSLDRHYEAVDTLAYYELVYMQILIQETKEKSEVRPGISQPGGQRKLQAKAIKTLSFDLTKSQKRAVVEMNKKLSEDTPSSTLLNADVGAGKGLPENEVILTPKGFVKIKDIKVGDDVVGSNGKPTRVIGVYPQGLQEVAKISFNDGSEITTDLNHLWTLIPMQQWSSNFKGPRSSKVISTGQLLNNETSDVEVPYNRNGRITLQTQKMYTHFTDKRGYSRWKLPLPAPVEYDANDEELLIDPYLLGYWLGDGTTKAGTIAVGSHDVENTVKLLSECWKGDISLNMDKRNGSFSLGIKKSSVKGVQDEPLVSLLRKENLLDNKCIPLKYLRASVSERLSLLQGLIDSDGSIGKLGSIEFGNTNKMIVDGAVELVRSLGGIAWVSDPKYKLYINNKGEKVRSPRASYAVRIDLPLGLEPCRLDRKLSRYSKNIKSVTRGSHRFTKSIINVEKLPEMMKTICIKVDAEDELFLTKDFIVTHNTIVAQLACLKAVESGHQAVLLGPTDILGRQLFATFEKLSENLKEKGEEVRIAYLSGGMKVRERKPILKAIKDGEIDIVVGTHSVLSDSVEYKDLSLVCIDEQQKFGAEQRTKLLNVRSDGRVPDLLMQSATPIPRSTAQVFYGDMDMIELKEKPPGRIPIVTEWLQEDPVEISHQLVHPLWSDIQSEAAKGNQTFVITPMVNESDKIDAASVERTFKSLTETSLPGLRVAYAHGQMKPGEQKIVMDEFRAKKYDVLVASTVVEVGVDIPDATRVVILSADRLGASSLHQIRGRVGRNSKPSKCYLVSLGKTENSQLRLQSLVDSENGFDIAKVDLQIRGEGKMFSVEQSGRSEMIFASLLKHGERIDDAKNEAKRILKSPFRALALQDSKLKFESDERLF